MTGPCGNKNCPHDLYNEQFGDNCDGYFSFGTRGAKHLTVPMICKDFKPCEPTLDLCPICGEMNRKPPEWIVVIGRNYYTLPMGEIPIDARENITAVHYEGEWHDPLR